jgi:hypothetical protein
MVNDSDAENLRGFDQSAGDVAILLAGGRVAGGVIVGKDHACRALPHCFAHDLAGVYGAGVEESAQAFDRRADDLVFRVE